MTDAAFDRRLRDWLEGRDPGPVPDSLRESAGRVALETPVPAVSRVWQAIVGPGRAERAGSPLRLVFALVVLCLLVAGVVAVAALLSGSRPAPLTSWGGYVVGAPAPDLDFGSVEGNLLGGDPTISVDDLPDFVVALYFPGRATADRTAADAGALVAAADHAPAGTAFLVIADASSTLTPDTLDRVYVAGMRTAEPPAGWDPAGRPTDQPVLIITNRRGVVAYVYVGDLPDADWLVGDLDRASVQ